jgi:hypothetical protein
MKPFHEYVMKFAEEDGLARFETVRAASPGHAQAKFYRKRPRARLLDVYLEGKLAGHTWCLISYEPVSTARVKAEPSPKVKETVFPFFDSCFGRRPSAS